MAWEKPAFAWETPAFVSPPRAEWKTQVLSSSASTSPEVEIDTIVLFSPTIQRWPSNKKTPRQLVSLAQLIQERRASINQTTPMKTLFDKQEKAAVIISQTNSWKLFGSLPEPYWQAGFIPIYGHSNVLIIQIQAPHLKFSGSRRAPATDGRVCALIVTEKHCSALMPLVTHFFQRSQYDGVMSRAHGGGRGWWWR